MTKADLEHVTVEEALNHPTWKMGAKITVDSATLMNKGLEVIEARWLFDVAPERVQVVVHPQSIVHSMVEYVDGSVIAQLGVADMGIPILYAFTYPSRLPAAAERLDLTRVGALTFEEPDTDRFPCLALARRALQAGGAGAGRAQCRQRDGGGRLPRRADSLRRDCPIDRAGPRAACRHGGSPTSRHA